MQLSWVYHCPASLTQNCYSFTVERVVHGPHQSYNDIVPFDYKHMLQFFNGLRPMPWKTSIG
jgi:TPP-dependent 2-oxoacid decarboxylase